MSNLFSNLNTKTVQTVHYTYTYEQNEIFKYIIEGKEPVVSILATAGSSKSSSIIEATRQVLAIHPDLKIRYLIYGSMASIEARKAFGATAIVSTIHSYAYHHTIKPYNLSTTVLPFLTWMNIPKAIKRPFGIDSIALEYVDNYCNSKYLSFSDYLLEIKDDEEFNKRAYELAAVLLDEMAEGKMPITHSFYLKFFHIKVMNGEIQLEAMDKLYLDEAQDSSSIMLDIFDMIPAKQKVLVGDRNQKIFAFLNLEDGFLRHPKAKILELNKSFRVDQSYAPAINSFMKNYLNSTSEFIGMDYKEKNEVTKAYLCRNNSSLIAKMIELNKIGTPYHLATSSKIKQMFKFPLAVIYAKPGFQQRDPELKYLQNSIDNWGRKHPKKEVSLHAYLLKEDMVLPQIKQAITLSNTFESDLIIKAFNEAGKHQKTKCDLNLLTVHASKGGSWDVVKLDDDINKAAVKVMVIPEHLRTEDDISELNTLFVSVTRHRFRLINAKFLGL